MHPDDEAAMTFRTSAPIKMDTATANHEHPFIKHISAKYPTAGSPDIVSLLSISYLGEMAPELTDIIFSAINPITTERRIPHDYRRRDNRVADIHKDPSTSVRCNSSLCPSKNICLWNIQNTRPIHRDPVARSTLPWKNIRLTNKALDTAWRQWFYGTGTFTFDSRSPSYNCFDDDDPKPNSASLLVHWAQRHGEQNLALINHLHLTMTHSELLLLFAPPTARRMLRIDQAVPADSDWNTAREILTKALTLSSLTISILPDTCPEPCPCLDIAHVWDRYIVRNNVQFAPDETWAYKAVAETMGSVAREVVFKDALHGLGPGRGEQAYLKGMSWEAMGSATQGFHRGGSLWERKKEWEMRNGRICFLPCPGLKVPVTLIGVVGKEWVQHVEGIRRLWEEV